MATYTREDVRFHSDGFFGGGLPAVNVKVHSGIDSRTWEAFERDEGSHDPRFTPEWVEANVSDDRMDDLFWRVCGWEYEYLERWATGKDGDSLFPDDCVELSQEGRMGGWVVVSGLPDLEDWDAVRLARWRKFERIAREIADGIPLQMLSSLYANEFEWWAEEQADESISNSELPVDLALAGAVA